MLVSRRHALDISYTRPELLPAEALVTPTSASSLSFPSSASGPPAHGRAPFVSIPATGALQIIASARAHPTARPIVPGGDLHQGGKASPAVPPNAPSGIARQGKALQPTKAVPVRKAAMTRGGGQKVKGGGKISQVDWLTKVVKVPRENHESHDVSTEASTLPSRVGSQPVSKSRRESHSRPSSGSRDRRTIFGSIDGGGDDKFISLKDE